MSFRPVKPREYGTTKEAVSRLLAEAGGIKEAAHQIKLKPSQVYAYTDPQDEAQISFDDVCRLTKAAQSTAAAAHLAALAGAFVTRAEAGEEDLGRLMARGEREHGAAMAVIAERLGRHSEGALPAGERAKLMRDLDGMIRAFVAARRKIGEGP